MVQSMTNVAIAVLHAILVFTFALSLYCSAQYYCYSVRDDSSRCVDVTADVIDNNQHVHACENNNAQWRRLACPV